MSVRRFKLAALGLGVLLAFRPAAGVAQDDLTALPFEELLRRDFVSASRLARQVSDSPAAVSIVTADDIRAYGYRTLAEVINSMRGLYTTDERTYHYMGGRGFGDVEDYAGRVMLLIDGYAVQDNLFDQAYIDESGLIDLELVERVEYVPGTGSVTYGNNALLGILNVVTRRGRDFDGARVSAEISSRGGSRQRATWGKRLDNGAEVLLSASTLDVDGRNLYFPAYDTPATNHGVAEGLDGERSQRVFGKLAWGGWTVQAAWVEREKNVPTNPSAYTAFNTPFPTRDESAFLGVRHETDLGLQLSSSSSLMLGRYGYWNQREYALNEDGEYDDGEKYGVRDFTGAWWRFDQKFVGRWFTDHTLVFGAELRDDHRQSFRRRFLAPDGEVTYRDDGERSRRTVSLYIADDYRLSDRWTLNLGARHDDADDLDGNLSPRVALIWQPDPATTWKASYSEAFKMPNANDRWTSDDTAVPEYVAATELVLQRQLAAHTRFTGALYRYRRSDLLVYDDALEDYVPAGSSRAHGVEAEIEHLWERGARVRASVAWQRSRDVQGRDAVNSPDLLGKLAYTFLLPGEALRAGVEAQYLGPRLTRERRMLGGHALAHLTLTTERDWHGLSASLSARNLFDRDYETVSGFDWRPGDVAQDGLRMDGRSVWLQIGYAL
ncbi:MAG: TonB-dependent receptor [Rhodocyclaceae bacterium]|nr:MAG: TonB-dependent receptor [Rhodocyclaceae bacterium]